VLGGRVCRERQSAGTCPVVAVILVSLVLAGGASATATEVRIVEPTTRTIAYGATSVVTEGPSELFYRVYLRRSPEENGLLVCNQQGPFAAGDCAFDAGIDLGSEWLLLEAVDGSGSPVARDEVQTYFFQQPVSVARERVNPLVEIALSGAENEVAKVLASPGSIECELGGKPCEVLSLERLGHQGLLRVSLLIDESNSIGREGLEKLMPAIDRFVSLVQQATGGRLAVEYEVVFFAERSRNATFGFTDDPYEVKRALATAAPEGGTCLYEAVTERLQSLERWELLDEYAGRQTSYAMIVWSDGEEACPFPATSGAAAIEEAGWSEIPIFVVPEARSYPDGEFLALGWLSGGATFESSEELASLLTGTIFQQLTNRYLAEIDGRNDSKPDGTRSLRLSTVGDVELRHRRALRAARPKREVALAVLKSDASDAEAKAVASAILVREPEPVSYKEAESIYREMKQLVESLRKDLELQAREQGREELAQILRRRRRLVDDTLTRKELAVVRLLRPDEKMVFMETRNAMLEAILVATGRALLWQQDAREQARYVRLLETMTREGYRLAHPGSDLSVYIRAALDPDFPLEPALRQRLRSLLDQ
jgi:hypothetical protein